MEEKKMFAITSGGAVLASDAFTLDELINATSCAILNMMKATIDNLPEDQREEARGVMYDYYNNTASALLEAFAPDKELRPDLTAEAIMAAEDQLLDKKVAQFKDKGSAKK